MSQADPPRAVLDADIIYLRVLHELMGRVADDLRLLDLAWSEDLLAETRRSLAEKKTSRRRLRRAGSTIYRGTSPMAGLTSLGWGMWMSRPSPMIPTIIMYVRSRSLRAPATSSPTTAATCVRPSEATELRSPAPDPFLAAAFGADPEGFLELIELQAGGWAEGRPISELLVAIERAGAESFAGKVRTALGP